jgi:hypothetical protein
MDGERPWPAPTEHVVAGRRWKYAPPPWVMYEAVVNEMKRWLMPQRGELQPKVKAKRRPDAILIKPWVDPAVQAIELQIEPDSEGSAITVLAYGEVPALPDEVGRRLRHRLGEIFGAQLRDWLDEPHL